MDNSSDNYIFSPFFVNDPNIEAQVFPNDDAFDPFSVPFSDWQDWSKPCEYAQLSHQTTLSNNAFSSSYPSPNTISNFDVNIPFQFMEKQEDCLSDKPDEPLISTPVTPFTKDTTSLQSKSSISVSENCIDAVPPEVANNQCFFGYLSFDGVSPQDGRSKGRKGKLSHDNRKKVADVRQVGACPQCKRRKVACSLSRPCQPCLNLLASGKRIACLKTISCFLPGLFDTNVFVEGVFTFPCLDLEFIESKRQAAATTIIQQYHTFDLDTDAWRYFITHEDFRRDLSYSRCNEIFHLIGGNLQDVMPNTPPDFPDLTLSQVMPLMEKEFGSEFKHDLGGIFGHYVGDDLLPSRGVVQLRSEENYFASLNLLRRRDHWYACGTRFLRTLHRSLQHAAEVGYDRRQGRLLIVYILYATILSGKARSSPLVSSESPPEPSVEAKMTTLLRSLICCLILLGQHFHILPPDHIPESRIDQAIRSARDPYTVAVVPKKRHLAGQPPRLVRREVRVRKALKLKQRTGSKKTRHA